MVLWLYYRLVVIVKAVMMVGMMVKMMDALVERKDLTMAVTMDEKMVVMMVV